MPRRTIRCRRIVNSNGKILVRFSDKAEHEFASRAELKQWVREQLSDNVLKAVLIAAVIEDADGVPLSQCDGKRITLDWAATPLLTVLDSAT